MLHWLPHRDKSCKSPCVHGMRYACGRMYACVCVVLASYGWCCLCRTVGIECDSVSDSAIRNTYTIISFFLCLFVHHFFFFLFSDSVCFVHLLRRFPLVALHSIENGVLSTCLHLWFLYSDRENKIIKRKECRTFTHKIDKLERDARYVSLHCYRWRLATDRRHWSSPDCMVNYHKFDYLNANDSPFFATSKKKHSFPATLSEKISDKYAEKKTSICRQRAPFNAMVQNKRLPYVVRKRFHAHQSQTAWFGPEMKIYILKPFHS